MSAAPLDPARLDAIFDEFEELSRELVGLQRQVAAVHADLALLPDRAGERTLDALRAERDEKLMRWATLALAWRLEGGRIVLEDPDETMHERVDGARATVVEPETVRGDALGERHPVETERSEYRIRHRGSPGRRRASPRFWLLARL